MEKMRLKGKVAMITGAAMGLGKGTAILFAKEGAKVVIVDIEEEAGKEVVETIEKANGEAMFVKADLIHADQVQNAVKAAVDKYGKLDVLINNASIYGPGSVTDVSEEDWDKEIAVDLKSVFLCCKYAIPEMKKAGGGSIINISSCAATLPVQNNAAYTAAKSALHGLTKEMCLDYGPDNIRVNGIAPGIMYTRMTRHFFSPAPELIRQTMIDLTPIGRLGEPEDIGWAAVFLASDESTFVTGHIMAVDGGITTHFVPLGGSAGGDSSLAGTVAGQD